MSHAVTWDLDLNHGHLPDRETMGHADYHAARHDALEDAKMELSNDRKWVAITFALLAVMSVVCSAIVVLSVLYS